jgi:hypothetical protein
MTKRSSLHVLLLAVPVLFTGACANAFIKGGKMATADHATGARAAYRVNTCTKLSDNSNVEAPKLTWHLFEMEGKPALFERDEKGKGVVIQNHWADAAGEHYYVGVTSNGWEYVFPQGGAPSRVIYQAVSVTQNADGSTRPVSAPMARCELVAQ